MTGMVLVVDDIPANVKLLEVKLTNEYYDVTTAKSGVEALKVLETTPVDIILLDVMMPEMDGFEACRRIKANPALAHIPVVMVTALTETKDRVTGLKAGADDFITKPINDVALFARIRSLIRLKLMTDQLRLRNQTGEQFGALSSTEFQIITDTAGASIAIIDDDTLQVRQVSDALAGVGHKPYVISNPAEAIVRLPEIKPDLVIVSTMLTEGDGLRLCMQIHAQPDFRNVPLLIIADEEDKELILKGLELGVNDYIVSPIEINELIARTVTLVKRKRYQDAMKENYQQSVSLAVMDGMTKLYNRRYFDVHYDSIFKQAKEQQKKLAVIMADIDHFKSVNDTHGHQVGDEVIKEVARRLSATTRDTDFVARYGGEEFVMVLPSATLQEAQSVADRLLGLIRATPVTLPMAPGTLAVTISIGIACISAEDTQPADLVKHADEALYKAKHGGRNRAEAYVAGGTF